MKSNNLESKSSFDKLNDAHYLLIEATKKLIDISRKDEWKNELLSKAPPVLWFGNSNSKNKKIVTIGANPSRWEFLDKSLIKKCPVPLDKNCYENFYLSKQRFFCLSDNQSYEDIVNNEELRKKIVDSYNNYFNDNPYKWFGKNSESPYNVEGFLRGMNASFYDKDGLDYQGCHIDIFPFATISDFKQITNIVERDIFSDDWAKNVIDRLLKYLNPNFIIIFGSTNFKYLIDYLKLEVVFCDNFNSCKLWVTENKGFKIIGLSINLGNPVKLDSHNLQKLGNYVIEKFTVG